VKGGPSTTGQREKSLPDYIQQYGGSVGELMRGI